MDDCLRSEIERQCRFADAVRSDQHDVRGVLDELKRHQLFDGSTIAPPGPGPVEVAERFEAAQMGIADASLQRTASALVLSPLQQWRDPRLGYHIGPVCEQSIQAQGVRAALQII